ncbi:BTB/POZ domain-containing protein 9 [Pteropus alecto]|uniref:BTB/POZ domain-containing protein 9 n=1 Tax=Pteropus alecto TaxID=9402 RepID=L5KYL0_PTEAL|nr:BTB/POZ domain-containing protein 9 [Pteropus alecto]
MKQCRCVQLNKPIVALGVVWTKELMTQKYFEFLSWKMLDAYNMLGQNGFSPKLLLWDCDDRSYSYYVEVSTNQQQWTMVADRTKVSCKSWQSVTFERQPASFIRIVGTHNTANEVFHCVHFECPEQQSSQKEENSEELGTGDTSPAGQQLDPHALQAPSGNSLPSSPGSNPRSSNRQHQ